MSRATANLALSLGVAAQRLRHGRALDESSRLELADLLMRTAMVLHGANPPARLDADPEAFVTVAVEAAREAGMAGPDIVEAVNNALERSARPERLRAGVP